MERHSPRTLSPGSFLRSVKITLKARSRTTSILSLFKVVSRAYTVNKDLHNLLDNSSLYLEPVCCATTLSAKHILLLKSSSRTAATAFRISSRKTGHPGLLFSQVLPLPSLCSFSNLPRVSPWQESHHFRMELQQPRLKSRCPLLLLSVCSHRFYHRLHPHRCHSFTQNLRVLCIKTRIDHHQRHMHQHRATWLFSQAHNHPCRCLVRFRRSHRSGFLLYPISWISLIRF